MTQVKALIITGYGLNCDYETDFSFKQAGAAPSRIHINELIQGTQEGGKDNLSEFHILVFGGGFSWGDDHGAGVLMASKMKRHLDEHLQRFLKDGKLILGICNGFQVLVNLGLVPGFDSDYRERAVALTYNDKGNFIDCWVNLTINEKSPCIFTQGLSNLELPVRHGEGKFYTSPENITRLFQNNQVVVRYADEKGNAAEGRWPFNPNGSIEDIAGICDPTGRVFGLMPHPEAFNHFTNHPEWTRKKAEMLRMSNKQIPEEGEGIKIFRNAVEYLKGIF